MSLLDAIFGKAPEYDPEDDPLMPDARESRDHAFHVRQDGRRHASTMQLFTTLAGQQQATQRLLIIIIALLIASKVIDVSVFTGFLTP